MWGIKLIDPANTLQTATMMRTDRDLDALTYPPIDALKQATRHPQSVPTGPGRRLATTPPGSLVAQTKADRVSGSQLIRLTGFARSSLPTVKRRAQLDQSNLPGTSASSSTW